jgi:hypothetical protein
MVFNEMAITETVQQYKYSHLDHEVLIHKSRHRAAQEWCEQQFGRQWEAIGYRSGTWAVFWAGRESFDQYRFCFAQEKDLVWFTLRWM